MKLVVNSAMYVDAYVTAFLKLLNMAGFFVDIDYDFLDDEAGDIAIYADGEDLSDKIEILEMLRACDLI